MEHFTDFPPLLPEAVRTEEFRMNVKYCFCEQEYCNYAALSTLLPTHSLHPSSNSLLSSLDISLTDPDHKTSCLID
jgi:hypothetical protein